MVLSLIPIGPSRKAEATEPSFAELSVVALTQYRSVRRFPRSSDSTPQAAYPLPLVHLTALTERYWALTHAVEVEGQSLPKGALGTVVAAYGDGVGYEVEFERPFHAVVTLQADDLTA